MKFTLEIQRKAKQVFTDNAVLRAIFNVLGDATPVYLNADTGNFMNAYQTNHVVYSVLTPIIKRCATIGVTTLSGKSSKVVAMLENPNPMMTRTELVQSVITNLAACGVAFIWKNKPNGVTVQELWNVPAKDVVIYLNKDLTIKHYKFGWRESDVPASDVIMLRLPNPDNTNPGQNITGLSPLNACIKVLAEIDEAVNANAKTLKNRMPQTMISGATNSMITEDQMRDLEKQIREAGSQSKFFATSAQLKATQLGFKPVDLDIHQTLTRAKRDIAAVYGVPFEYFEPSTYSNKGDAKQDFINNAVLPMFTILLQAINMDPDLRKLTTEPLIIDLATIPELRKDLVSLATSLSTMWWLTGNEKRVACDYVPIPDPLMDVPLLPPGLTPVDQLNDINLTEA